MALSMRTEKAGPTAGLYAEYGLRPEITLGAKLDLQRETADTLTRTALVFMRRPIGPTDKALRFAYDLGLGVEIESDQPVPFARVGFTFGRGFTLNGRNGWAVLDAAIDAPVDGSEIRAKIDATTGLSLNDRWKAMALLFLHYEDAETDLTIAPSVIYSAPKTPISFQVGAEFSPDETAFVISIWREF